jgi:hypothetical protein
LSSALVLVMIASCGRTTREVEPGDASPNPGETPALLCAAEGEDCSRDYLIANGLDRCCDSACLPNGDGRRTCRNAVDPFEYVHLNQCTTALEGEPFLEPVVPALRTSVGAFEFERVTAYSFSLGPGGCVSGLSVTLLAAGEQCSVFLHASPAGDSFVVDELRASLGECAGYTGADPAGRFEALGETPVTLEVYGLGCEGSPPSDQTCFGGEFAFTFDGQVEGSELAFEEQLVVLSGALCGETSGGCAGS